MSDEGRLLVLAGFALFTLFAWGLVYVVFGWVGLAVMAGLTVVLATMASGKSGQ